MAERRSELRSMRKYVGVHVIARGENVNNFLNARHMSPIFFPLSSLSLHFFPMY